MNYSYKFKLNSKDMWRYYMIDRYSTLAGIVQIILVVSVALLITSKWTTLGIILKIICIIILVLFIIVQPLAFYIKAKKAIDPNMPETNLSFNEIEMIIEVQSHIQKIKYENIVQVISKPFMLIIQPDATHIYILPSRILNGTKKNLYNDLKKKMKLS